MTLIRIGTATSAAYSGHLRLPATLINHSPLIPNCPGARKHSCTHCASCHTSVRRRTPSLPPPAHSLLPFVPLSSLSAKPPPALFSKPHTETPVPKVAESISALLPHTTRLDTTSPPACAPAAKSRDKATVFRPSFGQHLSTCICISLHRPVSSIHNVQSVLWDVGFAAIRVFLAAA